MSSSMRSSITRHAPLPLAQRNTDRRWTTFSALNSPATLRTCSADHRASASSSRCRARPSRMTRRATRTGSIRFLERRVRREVVRPVFPEPMAASCLGSMLSDESLSFEHHLLFTRKLLESPLACLKNRLCADRNGSPFVLFLIGLCHCFYATAKLLRKRLLHLSYM